jgi:drug/metabolite transporter (DMT)-like permease
MPTKSKTLPYIAAVVSSVIWGFSFVFTKDSLQRMGMFQLLGYRFLVAAMILTVLVVFRIIKIRMTKRKLLAMLPVALLEPVLYFTLETYGVKLTSATECGIVIALAPISITLFSLLLLKERITSLKWVSIGVCVAGVIVLALSKTGLAGGSRLMGIAALIGAVAAAGLYPPVSRKLSTECTPIEITFMMMCVGAVVFNIAGLALQEGGPGAYIAGLCNLQAIPGIAYLAVMCSVTAYFLLNYAISKLEANVIGTFINLVPLVSVLAGVAVAGDKLLPLQIAGGVLILAGVWGAARTRLPLPRLPDSGIIPVSKKRRESL